MFQIAAAGGAGINFHAGVDNHRPDDDKAYTPIARTLVGRYRAMPLYYGMLTFASVARGALVRVRLEPSRAELSAFAVRADDGSLRICLIRQGRRPQVARQGRSKWKLRQRDHIATCGSKAR